MSAIRVVGKQPLVQPSFLLRAKLFSVEGQSVRPSIGFCGSYSIMYR